MNDDERYGNNECIIEIFHFPLYIHQAYKSFYGNNAPYNKYNVERYPEVQLELDNFVNKIPRFIAFI